MTPCTSHARGAARAVCSHIAESLDLRTGRRLHFTECELASEGRPGVVVVTLCAGCADRVGLLSIASFRAGVTS